MRPLNIELQYFGPYEHETIDFTQFRKQSLFLVAGNTGAGKTTIFDAMCYALFGQTTNDRDRSATALRSDFAPADRETFVKFTFVHQNITYQIMRRPKQVLRGRQGNLVEHNQAVDLIYPLDNQDPNEITKIREADTFITDLLNLTRDQFKQIVLLPQGKFRQFLDSDSNTKEALLRDLFNTAQYEQWTQRLKEGLRDRKKELGDQQTKVQSLKETINAVDSQLPVSEWLKAATEVLDTLTSKLQGLREQEAKQQELVSQLDNKLHTQQELTANLTALKETESAITKLAAKKEEISKDKAELTAIEWYQNQRPDYQRWQDGENNLQTLKQELAELTQTLAHHRQMYHTVNDEYQQLKDRQSSIDHIQEKAMDLRKQLPLFAKRDSLTKKIGELQESLTNKKTIQAGNHTNMTAWQQRLAELTVKINQNADLATRRVDLVKRQNEQEKLMQTGDALVELLNKVTKDKAYQQELTVALKEAQSIANSADNHLVELNDMFARHQIALLAQKLKPGSPCPVCGAVDHPCPAHLQDSTKIVSEEEVKTATAKAQANHANVTRIQEQLKQVTNRITELTTQIDASKEKVAQLMGETKLTEDWQQQISSRAEQLLQSAKRIAQIEKDVQKWQKESDELQHLITTKQDEFSQFDEQIAQLNQQLVTQRAILAENEESLPQNIADEQAATDQINAYKEEVDQYNQNMATLQEKLQTAKQNIAITHSHLDQTNKDITNQQEEQAHRHDHLEKTLTEYNGDFTWEFWQKAEKMLPQLVLLRDKVTEYERQVRDNQQEQQRLIKLINGQVTPNIKATKDELAAAKQQVSQYQQEIGQVTANARQLQTTTEKVTNLLAKTNDLDKKINELQTLTDVVSGNTENHVSLERYVLQAYFQDVLIAANVQLARLTNGRYQFELSTENHGAGTKWSGLEVNVYDDNAGRTRSARTLSGGESFMASLALALALCQIIQEQNGGINIDALFIDEGFGSLDQQALTDALHALQELEGHRMIGIISHVTELEEQIPDQLIVNSINGRSRVSYQHEI
ncbi:SMC family ATPase [Limosilactobacillus sp. STM2_1]|uniref:Nuclease SbcCD subunit C n=1 Tax=Limosilactobacillus rudii TaxID=2759755 RepID=A0A7W3YMN5_9LACO|nr:SMC family ATPase [Limosilactobacillus rudii]MBB1078799.1 SMC family ATPase [Limosilactobacillus rudii]MBB1097649.1 SMC family ATPase [Limosilactobacillus rudii]MCD7134758.1 SMC family ATPase [Limosilactobacillus rudii]